jgi:4a-hydroxytetrahydrobiopterin dehydratase
MTTLTQKTCKPCEGGIKPLDATTAHEMLSQLTGWDIGANDNVIQQDFRFKNYYQTMAFVNAVAWVAHQDDHHPDLEVGYNHCLIRYSTHAIGGLSENDFICAAKIDALLTTDNQL